MLELVVQKCNTYLDCNCWPTVIFSWPTAFSEQCYFYYIHYKWFGLNYDLNVFNSRINFFLLSLVSRIN